MNECSLLTKHKFQCTVPASQDALSLLALSVQQTTPPAPERGQTTGPDPHLDTLVQSRECTVTPPHSTDHTIIGFTTDAFPLPKHFLVTVSVGHKQRWCHRPRRTIVNCHTTVYTASDLHLTDGIKERQARWTYLEQSGVLTWHWSFLSPLRPGLLTWFNTNKLVTSTSNRLGVNYQLICLIGQWSESCWSDVQYNSQMYMQHMYYV